MTLLTQEQRAHFAHLEKEYYNLSSNRRVRTEVIDEAWANDLFQSAFDYLKEHPSCTDEELAQHLQLKRPASARFWRLKVKEAVEHAI
jgi:hypothetical protein